MGAYYVMIHFDGPYVNGFVVPEANSEEHALKVLKKSIWARIQLHNARGTGQEIHLGEDNVPKLKMYMQSLKRPWRKAGEYRGEKGYKHSKRISNDPVVRIVEMKLPVHAGYWLSDIITGGTICSKRY